jgi:hypothetical protein
MALLVPDESYSTVAEADAYFLALNNTAWTGTDPEKEAWLRQGKTYLETTYKQKWQGFITDIDQPSDWPRTGVIDGNGRIVDADTIPDDIKAANNELALDAISGSLTSTIGAQGTGIKREKVGSLETEYWNNTNNQAIYQTADNLVKEYLKSSAQSAGNARLGVK